ncbi:isoaspartyl peptidase/L-asparaginase isoform X3 [Leptinotarsa decemlineata]|uniref:isoaspartyl peptidase/L-asparaginase isoform X3 n=1 Tax=Leptinotarsa decemlineata TaxID=7539 RepID=UPI003D30CF7B
MWLMNILPLHSRVIRSFTSSSFKTEPIIIVHGGAGDTPDEWVPDKILGIKKSVSIGYKILKDGGSALDAVEAAVRVMEDLEEFNAGYGSVLNIDGEVEMDASIMLGENLKSGAVTLVKDIAHPISSLQNPGDVGTVGAVALDNKGNIAAATSTGGLTGKMVGRCSDSSIIGSGTYADNNIGAVSSTGVYGHGESIAKFCLAHSIIKQMEYGKKVQIATEQSLKKLTQRLNRTAGAITLSKNGEPAIFFNTKRMAWAFQQGNKINFGIDPNQNETVDAQV